MATIVGDKLKLSNYSYFLNREGNGFLSEFQIDGNRTRQQKLVDAVDIDWRPFRFKNFAYVSTADKATYTYVTDAGDLFDTERLIDWISYSYSMGYNLRFHSYIYHNKQYLNIHRPNMITNIGWIDRDSRIIGYTYWPVVGAQYNAIDLNKTTWEGIYNNKTGEIFNDYEYNIASGNYSHAEGQETIASGNHAHAEGLYTIASGHQSHTEGSSTKAIGNFAHTEGQNSEAHGAVAHAEGHYNLATGNYSHAEGDQTNSYGESSHSEGKMTMAVGNYSHTEGFGGIVNVKFEGSENYIANYGTNTHYLISYGDASHAEGIATVALKTASHAEGVLTYSCGAGSHAEGVLSYVHGNYSHAEGYLTTVYGIASHAEGYENTSRGNYSHITGYHNTSSGEGSIVGGYNNTEQGKYNIIFGQENNINSEYSNTSGLNNTNTGYKSFVFGELNTNTSASSVVFGTNNNSNDQLSFIFGDKNKNDAMVSTLFGIENTNSGMYSNIFGLFNINKNHYAEIFGLNNVNNGDRGILHGQNLTNAGIGAILFGDTSYNNGKNSLVFGIDNLSYSANVLSIGQEIYNTGAEKSIISGFNLSSYSTNSILIGHNNTVKTSSNAIAIGHTIEITDNKTNPVAVGNNIKFGFGSSGDIIAFGKDINGEWGTGAAPGHSNIISIGKNIKNVRTNSFLIGEGLLNDRQNGKDDVFITGKYNKELKSGYYFALGYGTSDTNRKNTIEITTNGWSYIGALATYINNIEMYNEHIPIAYNMNFVEVFSYKELKRSAYNTVDGFSAYSNTYTFSTNSYILPTKQYIDKLLELKDAFRFAGTFEPANTNITFAQEKTDHTVSGTWIPTTWYNNGETDNKTTTYDSSTAAVWRVTKRGWFGTYVVEGGDLLIAYADATRTSDQNWAIIETHMNWVNNTGLDLTNQNDKARVLANFHLTDSGILSYTYTHLTTEYRFTKKPDTVSSLPKIDSQPTTKATYNDRNTHFLSNISLLTHDDRIEIAYTYTDFGNYLTYSLFTYSLHRKDNINNTQVDHNGIAGKVAEGIETSKSDSYLNDTDAITYISEVNLNSDGILSYTKTSIYKLRTHHDNVAYKTNEFNIDSTERTNSTGDKINVITNVNLSKEGTLTYNAYNLTHLRNHHHTLSYIHNGDTNGRNAYNRERDLDVRATSYDVANDVLTNSNRTLQVLTYAYLSSDGSLTAYYANVSNIRRHHVNCYSNSFTAPSHIFSTHASKTSNPNGDTIAAVSYTEQDYVYVLDNVHLNDYGYLTYSYTYIQRLRNHHDTTTYTFTTYNVDSITNATGDTIRVQANVHLDAKGTLTYTGYVLTHMKYHHHSYEHHNDGSNYRTGISEVDTKIDSVLPENDNYKVLSYTYIDNGGALYSYYYDLVGIRHHHHTYAEFNNNGTNYRTDVREVNTDIDAVLPENDKYKVLTYAYINSGGVAYTYYAKLDNLRHHHHSWEYHNNATNYRKGLNDEQDTNVDEVSKDNDVYKVLSYAYINSGGVAYTYYYNLSYLRHHHHTNTIVHNAGTESNNDHRGKYELDFDAYTSTYAKNDDWDKHRVLSYVWINSNGYLQSYYYTLHNLSAHHDTGKTGSTKYYTYTNRENWVRTYEALITNESDSITFIDGMNLNVNGKLSYHYSTIGYLRQHHTNYRTGTTAYDIKESTVTQGYDDSFGFVSEINLNSAGRLTYQTSSISNLKTHHGTTKPTKLAFAYDVYISNIKGDNEFGFVSAVNLDQYGNLSYSICSVTDLRNHHSDGFPAHSSNAAGNNFVTDVSLSVDGSLTGNFGSFGANSGTSSGTMIINQNDTSTVDVITGATIDGSGKLTYTYKTIQDFRNHHSTSTKTAGTVDADFTTGSSKSITVITGVNLSAAGTLTYTYNTISGIRNHHSTTTTANNSNWQINQNDANTIDVVTGASLSAAGTLTVTTRKIQDFRNHHSTTTTANNSDWQINQNDANTISVVTGASLSAAGALTVTTRNIKDFRNHHSTTTTANNSDWQINQNDTNTISVVTGASLSAAGALTVTTRNIKDFRNHHTNIGSSANAPTEFVRRINMSTAGQLTYIYDNIWGSLTLS